jgi:excisionase family DNA binding protein
LDACSTDQILTLPEVAQLLKVAEKTAYTMAQNGQLPAFKVRAQWRFNSVDIDHWIEEQKVTSRDEGKDISVAGSLSSQIESLAFIYDSEEREKPKRRRGVSSSSPRMWKAAQAIPPHLCRSKM